MASHAIRNAKPRAIVGTPWFVRLTIYVVVAIVGLVLTVLGFVQPEQVDSWLGQTGSLAAMIGGLLAAANTGRASDESPAEEIARKTEIAIPAQDTYTREQMEEALRSVQRSKSTTGAAPTGDTFSVYSEG